MAKRGRRKVGANGPIVKSAAGNSPPPGGVPLCWLIWAHPSFIEIYKRELSIYSSEMYPAKIEINSERVWLAVYPPDSDKPFYVINGHYLRIDEKRHEFTLDQTGCSVGFSSFGWIHGSTFSVIRILIWEEGADIDYFNTFFLTVLPKFRQFLKTGELKISGRIGNELGERVSVPFDCWPHDPLAAMKAGRLDFENGILKLNSGETVYSIYIERVEHADAALAVPPARRGRRANADRVSIIQMGLGLLKDKGMWATNQTGWSQQADLERALLEYAESLGGGLSVSTIRRYIQEIVKQFQQGA